jgi:hypothetical protein
MTQTTEAARPDGLPLARRSEMTLNVYTVTADGERVPRSPVEGHANGLPIQGAFPPCLCPVCKPKQDRTEARTSGRAS